MTDFISRILPQSESWVHFWKTLEFGREEKLPWVAGIVLLVLFAGWIYRRDTAGLHSTR